MATQPIYDDDNDERGLILAQPSGGMLMPLDTAQRARAAIKAYEDLKAAIIRESDIQKIGGKNHIKKSGWLRIARAFGLTVEPVSERYETAEDGSFGYAIVVRAIAPNGASMQGDGMCWSTEKASAQRTRHNVRAHAYTRATNRAISNLVGGGEVSAEELQEYREEDEPAPASAPRPAARSTPAAAKWNALDDTDVKLIFHQMNVPEEEARRAILETIFHAMKEDSAPWNKPNVLKRLKALQDNADSLYDLPVGTRGN